MGSADWAITIAGGLAALAGLALLSWALLADRLRTRTLRRGGKLRRCPRCWYDMRAVAGLRCPECGREARSERRLRRSRRRWRWAAAAVLVLALGSSAVALPRGRNGAWKRWLPDTAVILLIPMSTDSGWAAEEMSRRLGFDTLPPQVDVPMHLADWQWSLLARACLRTMERSGAGLAHDRAQWITTYTVPRPERLFDYQLTLLRERSYDAESALKFFEMNHRSLTDSQFDAVLEAASDWIAEGPRPFLFELSLSMERLQDERDYRESPGWEDALHRAREVPLDPDAICDALGPCTDAEVAVICERLGLRRSGDDHATRRPGERHLHITSMPMFIDNDAVLDRLLIVDLGTSLPAKALAFVSRDEGWSFVGQLQVREHFGWPHSIHGELSTDGQRWLSAPYNGAIWLQLARERRVVQLGWREPRASTTRHHLSNQRQVSPFVIRLDARDPRVVRKSGSYVVRYGMRVEVSLQIYTGSGEDDIMHASVTEQTGEFEFPLGVPSARFDVPLSPGPWGGTSPRWLFAAGEQEIVEANADRLIELLHEIGVGGWACLDILVRELEPTPEVARVRSELADWVAAAFPARQDQPPG